MKLKEYKSFSEIVSPYSEFVRTNFRWMADGENTPSLDQRKVLLQKLWDWMIELEDMVTKLRNSMQGSAFFSKGLDLADYVRSELRSPIQEFSYGNIPRDWEQIEYELKDAMSPKLNQMAEEFHAYQNYTQLLELQLRYTTLYRRLQQWLWWQAFLQVHDTHMKVDSLTHI
jgi:hypothetical protein